MDKHYSKYGSIPHLPKSNSGKDKGLSLGQCNILTGKTPPWKQQYVRRIYSTVKYDGANMAIAHLPDGRLIPLTRSGNLAIKSPFEHHILFTVWLEKNYDTLKKIIPPGYKLCGEWLALAHGIKYSIPPKDIFIAFDLISLDTNVRLPYNKFMDLKIYDILSKPILISTKPCSVENAVKLISPIKEIEGVVYRCDRFNNSINEFEFEFAGKYVLDSFQPGKYLNKNCYIWNDIILPDSAIITAKDYVVNYL